LKIARQILVSGVVQGVGYRAWTERTARSLGVFGFVRNLDDGRVEIFAEGEERQVDALVVACWKGPTHAEVGDVAQLSKSPRGAVAFRFLDDAAAPEP
jgi:acylphosphatase